MEQSRIMALFVRLAGLTEEESVGLEPICQWGLGTLRGMLRTGAETPENIPRLELAAAGAVCRLYRLLSVGEGESLRAGDLQMTTDAPQALAAADRLWEELLASVADLVERNPLRFAAVGGGSPFVGGAR